MSHLIVTTKAYVLRVLPDDEQSLRVLLATKDHGVVVVTVQSGATLQSKHRSFLFVGSHVTTDMVRGYRGWILTGVREEGDVSDYNVFGIYMNRLGLWALQYLGVETIVSSELYDLCDQVLSILKTMNGTEKEHRENLSLWILESLLAFGGYREVPPGWEETRLDERPEMLAIRKALITSVIDASHLGKKKYKVF